LPKTSVRPVAVMARSNQVSSWVVSAHDVMRWRRHQDPRVGAGEQDGG
jgi:hypothetical protein